MGQWHNFLVGCSGVVAHNGPCVTQGEINALLHESPNANNYIGKSQFNNALKASDSGDAFLEQRVNSIIKNGDNGGNLTEEISDRIFTNHLDYHPVDAKIGSNNGIDGFYVKRNTNGQVSEIAAVESKQFNSNGGVQLSKADGNTNLPKQFSDDWFVNVRDRLRTAGKTDAANLIDNHLANPNIFKRYIIAIDKSTTNNSINILKLQPFN